MLLFARSERTCDNRTKGCVYGVRRKSPPFGFLSVAKELMCYARMKAVGGIMVRLCILSFSPHVMLNLRRFLAKLFRYASRTETVIDLGRDIDKCLPVRFGAGVHTGCLRV